MSELQVQRLDPQISALFNTTGKRIRMLRVGRGLTQVELSEALKDYGVQVNNTFISQIENGLADKDGDGRPKQPSMKMLAGLAQVLGTTTDFLLLLSDNPSLHGDDPQAAHA